MKQKRTLLVLAGLAALVAALVVWDQRRPSTDEAKREREQLVPNFVRDKIDRIEVERDGKRIVLLRAGGVWTVSGKLRADEDAVDALLSELELDRVDRRIAHVDETLLREVGLAAPRARVRAAGVSLAIGADGPAGHGVYARRDGDPDVLVVDRQLFTVVDRAPPAWRSSRLLLTNVAALKTISVGKLTLARAQSGWTVDSAPADDKSIESFLDGIDRARATRFLDGAGDRPGQPIVVDGRQEARLGGACPGHADEREVTRADGATLCFATAALAPLETSADALRDRRLFPFAVDAVTAVDLGDGQRTLALRRENGVWRITAPLASAGVADDPSVHDWLSQLQRRTDESGPLTLTVRTAQASVRHAVALPFPDPLQFHDRRMIDLPPDSIDRIEVQEQGKTRVLAADDEKFRPLVDTFAQLHALELSRAKLPHMARTLRAGGQTLTLDGDQRSCRGSTGGLSFTLRPEDCRTLLQPL